jgi:hypothetical protein
MLINAPAAGTAVIVACRRGYDYLKMAFSGVADKMVVAVAPLETLENELATSRWSLSVNQKSYGISNGKPAVNRLAPLAATILALKNSPVGLNLTESKALKRVASSSPIFGAVQSINFNNNKQ